MTFDPTTSPIGEDIGYPRERSTPAGVIATRRVTVDWADRYQWADFFITHPQYPYFVQAGATNVPYLIGIDIDPLRTNRVTSPQSGAGFRLDACAVYDKATVTLRYSSEGTGFHNNKVIMELIEQRFSADAVGTAGLTWGDNGAPLKDHTFPMVVPGETYTCTYPFDTSAAVALTPGNVNSDTFNAYNLNRSFAPGTLLYVGSTIRVGIQLNGGVRVSKSIVCHWRPVPWNYEFHAATQTWTTVLDAAANPINRFTPVAFTGKI